MRNDDLVQATSIEDVAAYIMNASDDYCNDGENVVVILRREDAIECFSILVDEYALDINIATINPEDEDLFYGITVILGETSIEPISSENGNYLDFCADYMLIDEDVPSAWLTKQSCDNFEILTFEDECDECGYSCYNSGEVKSFADFINILDSEGELTRLLKFSI